MPQMVRSISINSGSRAMWSDGMDSSATDGCQDQEEAQDDTRPLEPIKYKSSIDLLTETFVRDPGRVQVQVLRARSLDFSA